MDNSLDQIILILSCLSLGIIWVPLGKERKGIGLNYIINFYAIFMGTRHVWKITTRYAHLWCYHGWFRKFIFSNNHNFPGEEFAYVETAF